MIGTHDSCTGMGAKYKVFNLFKFLWLTLDCTIDKQISDGVEYLDIRIRRRKNKWLACHGIVDLRLEFSSIREMCAFLLSRKVICRLILERGSSKEFIEELNALPSRYKGVIKFAAIKKGWNVIFNRDLFIKDCTYTPFLSDKSLWFNIKRFLSNITTIKRYAKKHNPCYYDMLYSEIVEFVDFYKINKYGI